MSGHSKWSTIKRKKGAADAKKGAIFTRLSKDITFASRENGGDVEMNPSLRLAIKKAKSANMPSSNIDRAIKKGTGELPGIRYEDYIYEGYGPGGVAIMMEIMTDNKNRTVPDIRHIMTKNDGNLGEAGCVNWMFEKKGIIQIDKKNSINEEKLFDIALEFGAEDINLDLEDLIEVYTSPESFGYVSEGLESSGFNIDGEVSLIASSTVKLSGRDLENFIKLIDLLEEHEDIQKVYSNADFEYSELTDLNK